MIIQMRKNGLLTCMLLLFIVAWTGCQKDDEVQKPSQPENKYFVSATSLGTYSTSDLKKLASEDGFGSLAFLIKYEVEFYKVVYKTTFKGDTVSVSGLLAIPQGSPDPPSLLSAQHGTLFRSIDAPSNFPAASTGFELLASLGFVTILPDYIGYGVSQSITHPYYDKASAGSTVVDMIKAVKFFLQEQKFSTSDRLFLLGYSEGAYVTMAAQKQIETTPSSQLTVTAAAEGAGGYDLETFLSFITQAPTYSAPSFLAFIIKAYTDTYGWSQPYTYYFQEPYASEMPDLLNGSKTRGEIDQALTESPAALFNPVFYADLKNTDKETPLKTQLAKNSFLTWVPKSPTRLFHGTADVTVPFETSQVTYNRFKDAGATNVAFYPIEGGNHQTSVEPMMTNALSWILTLDK